MSEPGLPDDLRIGAQERDAAVTLLSDHFVAGRLEIDEYQQRIDVALRARTRGDLRRLFRDLPPSGRPFLTSPSAAAAEESGRLPEGLRAELMAEGLVILDENLQGSITYRDYRTPSEYTNQDWSNSDSTRRTPARYATTPELLEPGRARPRRIRRWRVLLVRRCSRG